MWWINQSLCPIRAVADFSAVLSIPIILYRIANGGVRGVSFRTQLLTFTIFALRYLDLFMPSHMGYNPNGNAPIPENIFDIIFQSYTASYNECIKAFLLFGSAVVTIVLAYKKVVDPSATNFNSKSIAELCLLMVPAYILTTYYRYADNAQEICWALSQYLSIVVMIPQIVATYKAQEKDCTMYFYMAFVAGFRFFYIPHWVMRYMDQQVWDPIAVFSAVGQLCILFMGTIILATQERTDGNTSERALLPAKSFDTALLLPQYEVKQVIFVAEALPEEELEVEQQHSNQLEIV